jgi:acetoacetate decarboxylase
LKKVDILKLPSMPAAGPSYPAGPYRFINREYMVITYEADAAEIADQLPEPLEPLDPAGQQVAIGTMAYKHDHQQFWISADSLAGVLADAIHTLDGKTEALCALGAYWLLKRAPNLFKGSGLIR